MIGSRMAVVATELKLKLMSNDVRACLDGKIFEEKFM
jgi:hypothetical protein